MHETDALLELRLLVLLRRIECATEVVEDRDQLFYQPLVGTVDQGSGFAGVALAVVVELRRESLQAVEELVALGLESAHVRGALLFGLRDLRLVCHYAFGASCSSSITS